MQVLINYVPVDSTRYTGVREFDTVPRKGEYITLGNGPMTWWIITDVIHSFHQHDTVDVGRGLVVIVAEQTSERDAVALRIVDTLPS